MVSLDIQQVIDNINCAGNQAEKNEPSQSSQCGLEIIQAQFVVEDEGGEEKNVFRPLAGAHGFKNVF
jgi:hypothetical protein